MMFFLHSFTNRLLQPAVNTSDILTQYISTIRALRALEPSGVILENVCQPLREYLRYCVPSCMIYLLVIAGSYSLV